MVCVGSAAKRKGAFYNSIAFSVEDMKGDLLKAVAVRNLKKARTEYKKFAEAKIALAKAEAVRII